METQKLHRGRLVDHIQLVTRDLDKSKRFYAAVLEVLGVPIGGDGPGFEQIVDGLVGTNEGQAIGQFEAFLTEGTSAAQITVT